MKTPTIFVSNDDGIHSPGLRAAVEAAMQFGKVLVVAPTKQGSSMGRCLRGPKDARLIPIEYHVNSRNLKAYHCECSPALAVKHGLDVLCRQRLPDLVISGINYGENLGVNITHSGTVGAALQAASKGIPALAVSLQTEFQYHFKYGELDWSAAKYFLSHFIKVLLAKQLPFDVEVLKIDIPKYATPETPWRMTRLARQTYYATYLENPSVQSKIGDIKLKIDLDESALEPDSDIRALKLDKVVSVTPLSQDLTSRIDFQSLKSYFERIE
ncbi:MAG: 5'/3'-nucleotidase SurE [bacterium]